MDSGPAQAEIVYAVLYCFPVRSPWSERYMILVYCTATVIAQITVDGLKKI